MTKELQDKLYADFPGIFRETSLGMRETCMCWGCECGDGWEMIIRRLCEAITAISGPKYMPLKTRPKWVDNALVLFANKSRWFERVFKMKPHRLYNYKGIPHVKHPGFSTVFQQVKEKFGTLRIYTSVRNNEFTDEIKDVGIPKNIVDQYYKTYRDKLDGMITLAEYFSEYTCEQTGKPGTLYTRGWYCVLCDELAKERGYLKDDGATATTEEEVQKEE